MIIEALLGRWQITESVDFPLDEINAIAPPYIEFDDQGGRFIFWVLEGKIYDLVHRPDEPDVLVSFDFEGLYCDSEAYGSGCVAEIMADGRIRCFIDNNEFIARRHTTRHLEDRNEKRDC